MTILARPSRPKPMSTSLPRAVLTAGMIAMLIATGGGAVATAQPSTTPAAPQVVQQAPAPAPVDPCATTTAPTATTTTAPPSTTATTSAVPTSCVEAPSESSSTQQAPVTQSAAPNVADVPAPESSSATTTIATAVPSAEATTPTPAGTRIPYTGLPTENPNSTLVPGKMRSDREEWPEGYTKEQADQAEIGEARLNAKQRMSRAAVTCQRYWPTSFDVCGAIRDKYNSLGGPNSFLWLPTSGNIINPGGAGERVTFVNGPIYWSAAGGAHPVVNSFLNRWGQLGYEGGWLAYPTTDEILLPDGGRRQEFQGGAVYVAFQNAIGSAIRNGPIRDKWNTIGGNAPGGSALGYITGDEIGLPDGQGRMARFERGVIYWSPNTGAHVVNGYVLTIWSGTRYEAGNYGYPVADSEAYVPIAGAVAQQFQGGKITMAVNEVDANRPFGISACDDATTPNGCVPSPYDTLKSCRLKLGEFASPEADRYWIWKSQNEKYLSCERYRDHIAKRHYSDPYDITSEDESNFRICTNAALTSGSPRPRAEGNAYSINSQPDPRGEAIVYYDTATISTSYTTTPNPGGDDWGGCVRTLDSMG